MSIAINFHDVTLAYRNKIVQKHINGTFEKASMTAVIGSNGCGKSTLIKAIARIIKPAQGYIENSFPKNKIAYLAQISEIDRSFPVTVFDFVSCGLWASTGAFKALTSTQQENIASALAAVGMSAHQQQLIGELSGGQFQRIRFAQLALQDAELILLDEPFAGVDEHTVTDLMCLLHYWHEQGKTLITVLHDLELVRQQFPQVIALEQAHLLGWGETSLYLDRYHKKITPTNTEYKTSALPQKEHP